MSGPGNFTFTCLVKIISSYNPPPLMLNLSYNIYYNNISPYDTCCGALIHVQNFT